MHSVSLSVKQIIDVLDVTRRVFPGLGSYKMCDIADSLNIRTEEGPHRALNDCLICNKIFMACLDKGYRY